MNRISKLDYISKYIHIKPDILPKCMYTYYVILESKGILWYEEYDYFINSIYSYLRSKKIWLKKQ
jgi:hypothetical protein